MGFEAESKAAGDGPLAGLGEGERAAAAVPSEARLASAVMFVQDLDASESFYRELLGLKVTVRDEGVALLVSSAGFQLYLRAMGLEAQHGLGGLGVQYVIWTAADREDLARCERLLKDAGVHVHTRTADSFTLIEGRDPSGVPLVMTYPGPDLAARHEIMSRIYTW
jgi:catechol 2,3-dioxygenase-like lactoylglutathione lyase family enzyme